MSDLFGNSDAPAPESPAMSDAERKRMRRRATEKPRGYAARPGTGPQGETCQTCRHCVQPGDRRYFKCDLNRAAWTHGPKTDIRARSPACAKWEARP